MCCRCGSSRTEVGVVARFSAVCDVIGSAELVQLQSRNDELILPLAPTALAAQTSTRWPGAEEAVIAQIRIKIFCFPTNISSLTWMTCTLCVCQTASAPSSSTCKRHWISMPAYKSTWEKPRCGIAEVMFHQVARRCKKLRHALTHKPESGEVRDFRHSKGFVCWASQLATRSMCRLNSGPRQRNTAFSSIGFLWSRTFKEAILARGKHCSRECLLHLWQPTHLMGRKGWSQMEIPSGWLQVIRGSRPRAQQWPSVKNVQTVQREVPGRWRQSKGATGNPLGPKPRLSPDAAREIAQSSVTKLEKALEAMGDVQGAQVRIDESQGRIEATCCGGGNRPLSKVHRQVGEADQRVGHTACRGVCSQDGGPGTSREVVGSAIPSPHPVQFQDPAPQVTSLQQMVNTLQGCVGARVAPGEAGIHRGRSARGQETSSREAGEFMSRSSRSRPIDAKVRPQRRDVVVARPLSRLSTGSVARRFDVCDRVGICGQHDLVNAKLVPLRGIREKQCQLRPLYGMRGVRVGEASHPGPVQTRNARRLLSTQVDPDDDPPVRSGRFGPLSSNSDGDHDVHVCRAPTSAVDCGRVAMFSGCRPISTEEVAINISQSPHFPG